MDTSFLDEYKFASLTRVASGLLCGDSIQAKRMNWDKSTVEVDILKKVTSDKKHDTWTFYRISQAELADTHRIRAADLLKLSRR